MYYGICASREFTSFPGSYLFLPREKLLSRGRKREEPGNEVAPFAIRIHVSVLFPAHKGNIEILIYLYICLDLQKRGYRI